MGASAASHTTVFWVAGSRGAFGATLHIGSVNRGAAFAIPTCGKTLCTAPIVVAESVSYGDALEAITSSPGFEPCPHCVDSAALLARPDAPTQAPDTTTYWLCGNQRQAAHVAHRVAGWARTLCGAPGAEIRWMIGMVEPPEVVESAAAVVAQIEAHEYRALVCATCEVAVRSAAGGPLSGH